MAVFLVSERKDEMEADLPSAKRDDQREGFRLVTNRTYNDKDHKGDIPPYGRHSSYEGRDKAVGASVERGTLGVWRSNPRFDDAAEAQTTV